MPTYRIFSFVNGHIQGPPEIVVADDDGAALEEAQRLLDHQERVEVWELDRCVAMLNPNQQGQSLRSRIALEQ